MLVMPQSMVMRAKVLRAPILSRNRLLGTSKRKYPTKKIPIPRPQALSSMGRSRVIWRRATPTLILSRYAMT